MGRIGAIGFIVIVLLVALPAGALAQTGGDEPSRAEFVDAADEICEVPYRKGLRLLGNADTDADGGDYVAAGKKVIRAGKIFIKVNDRISALVPPSADARLIEVWLNGTLNGFEQVVKSGKAMKDKRPGRADKLLKRANKTTKRANKKVAALGFDFCA